MYGIIVVVGFQLSQISLFSFPEELNAVVRKLLEESAQGESGPVDFGCRDGPRESGPAAYAFESSTPFSFRSRSRRSSTVKSFMRISISCYSKMCK
jgi:hypothetical protein